MQTMRSRCRKVLNPATGRYVKRSGSIGRALLSHKKRSKSRSRKGRSRCGASRGRKRQGPSISATTVPIGFKMTGNDGNLWRVNRTRKGVHRWVRV